MLQIINTEFTRKFNELNGKCADVKIKHALYGSQKINRCVLHPFVDGERIGLIINEEEIYITMSELQGVRAGSNEYVIESEVMQLYINLL